jgi:hypothetical protein
MFPEDLQAIRTLIHEEITASEHRTMDKLTEVMRDMQSEILRGLQSFARGNFSRMHTLESN